MRRPLFVAALSLVALIIGALAAAPVFAQQGLNLPGGGLQPPPPPPIKPYQAVAVTAARGRQRSEFRRLPQSSLPTSSPRRIAPHSPV